MVMLLSKLCFCLERVVSQLITNRANIVRIDPREKFLGISIRFSLRVWSFCFLYLHWIFCGNWLFLFFRNNYWLFFLNLFILFDNLRLFFSFFFFLHLFLELLFWLKFKRIFLWFILWWLNLSLFMLLCLSVVNHHFFMNLFLSWFCDLIYFLKCFWLLKFRHPCWSFLSGVLGACCLLWACKFWDFRALCFLCMGASLNFSFWTCRFAMTIHWSFTCSWCNLLILLTLHSILIIVKHFFIVLHIFLDDFSQPFFEQWIVDLNPFR